MTTQSTEINAYQGQLRERICDILKDEPFLGKMDHLQIARALIDSAFTWCDYNGGIDDTCHTAKRLHDLVDEAGAMQHSDYTHETLQKHLRKTNQS